MTANAPQSFGPFVAALEPAEVEAAAARYGLRAGLGGDLTASHHAPLVVFVLALLFAAILALTGFISRRAGELTFLIAAAAYMIQRLLTHRRIWRARSRGRAEFETLASGGAVTTRIEADSVTQQSARATRRLAFADCTEAEEAGGLLYLWAREGAPVVLPSRVLGEGETVQTLLTALRARIRRPTAA